MERGCPLCCQSFFLCQSPPTPAAKLTTSLQWLRPGKWRAQQPKRQQQQQRGCKHCSKHVPTKPSSLAGLSCALVLPALYGFLVCVCALCLFQGYAMLVLDNITRLQQQQEQWQQQQQQHHQQQQQNQQELVNNVVTVATPKDPNPFTGGGIERILNGLFGLEAIFSTRDVMICPFFSRGLSQSSWPKPWHYWKIGWRRYVG